MNFVHASTGYSLLFLHRILLVPRNPHLGGAAIAGRFKGETLVCEVTRWMATSTQTHIHLPDKTYAEVLTCTAVDL